MPLTSAGTQVSFTIPSGNFGNIYSGHLARAMGLPIRHLVLAANENNVLDQFFRTGTYAPRTSAETFATSSPSMDISKASNLSASSSTSWVAIPSGCPPRGRSSMSRAGST